MAQAALAVLTLLAAAVLLATPVAAVIPSTQALGFDWTWRDGRGTMYGTDAWSIHKGNCGFGYIYPDQPAGYDVVALSDQAPDFAGSCGACYEIKCRNAVIRDGYGTTIDRSHACYDPDASLIVRVVDSCPCNYPANYYSNKRWCCGDMYHMDVSVWAFEKLADKNNGVMALSYRRVPCNYKPAKPAPPLASPTPMYEQPWGVDKLSMGDTSSISSWNQQQSGMLAQGWALGDPTGSSSTSSSTAPGSVFASASASSSATGGSAVAVASAASSSGSSSSSSSFSGAPITSGQAPAAPVPVPMPVLGGGMLNNGIVFQDSLQNGWYDRSWSSRINWQAGRTGVYGQNVVCGDVYGGGALAMGHAVAAFQGAKTLEFWVRTNGGGMPGLTVSLGNGAGRGCTPLPLSSLQRFQDSAGYTKLAVNLGHFGGAYDAFNGCGGMALGELNQLEFKNGGGGTQGVCLDLIKLTST